MATHSSTLPGKSHGQRSLVGCSSWARQELDRTEQLHFHFSLSCIGEGNGSPLQCSCLENPRDGGAGWAACRFWGCTELDTTEATQQQQQQHQDVSERVFAEFLRSSISSKNIFWLYLKFPLKQFLKDLPETCKFHLNYSIPVSVRENTLRGLQIPLSGYHVGTESQLVKGRIEREKGSRTSQYFSTGIQGREEDCQQKFLSWDFPDGSGVKNLPCKAGDMDLSPGQGPEAPPAAELLSQCAATTEPQLITRESLCAAIKDPHDSMKILHGTARPNQINKYPNK